MGSVPILIIAQLTLREMLRRRVVLAAFVLTLLVFVLTAWGFQKLPELPCGGQPCSPTVLRTIAAVFTILLMFMFSFIIALGAAFLAAPAIAGDVDSGIALAMLPRPIRRLDVVVGKWLALAALIAVYTVVVCGVVFAITRATVDYQPPNPALAMFFIAWEGIALLTLALAGSTRLGPMACGIAAVVLYGVVWVLGVAQQIGLVFENQTIVNIGAISTLILPTDGLWRGALYALEPAALLAAGGATARAQVGNPFMIGGPPTTPFLVWAALWIAAVLALAVYSFQRRDL
ncbi:MAG: ABC transporter permease subunit [Anaerolineae bacterium]